MLVHHLHRVWDADIGTAVGQPLKHGGEVAHAAFSPDGRFVLTASHDKTARVWNAATGEKLLSFPEHTYATFSPDGQHFATASADKGMAINTITIRKATTGESIGTFGAKVYDLMGLKYSPDGRRLAVVGQDPHDGPRLSGPFGRAGSTFIDRRFC